MSTTSDEESSPVMDSDAAKNQRAFSRLNMFTLFLCLVGTAFRSMTHGMFGASLPDLLQLTNTTTPDAGKLLVPKSLGFVFGAVPVRYFLKHGQDLVAALALLALAVATVLVPVSSNFLFMTVATTLQSVAAGTASVVMLTIFIELCDENHREAGVQADFAFRSCGAIFGPLMIRPFLSKEITNKNTWNNTFALNNTSDVMACWGNCSQRRSTRWTKSHVLHGYAILSTLLFVLAVGFFVVHILKKCSSKNSTDMAPNQAVSRKLKEIFSSTRVIVMTVIIFTINTFVTGTINLYGNFITTFCIDPAVGIPKAEAALMISAFGCAASIGRLNGACWISKKLSPFQIIIIALVGLGVMFFILCFWADKSRILLWVSNVYFGLLYAPVLPSLLSLSLNYVAEDPLMMSIPAGAGVVGALIFPAVVPPLFVTIGPMVLMYALFGCIMVSLIFTISLYPLMRQSPQYNQLQDTELVSILDKSKNTK